MANTKLIKLKDGAILIYKKRKMKCTSAFPCFVFSESIRAKFPEPTAHFCEHMFFNGTKNLTKEEFGKKRMEVLPSFNAATAVDRLYFYVFRSNKMIKEALEFVADTALNPVFDPECIEKEKGVIKQELVRKNSSFSSQFDFAFARTVRDHYILPTQVLGSSEEIDKIDRMTLQNFYNEMFARQNFVCTVVSGLPLFKIKRYINKYFVNPLPSNPEYPNDKFNLFDYNFEKSGNMVVTTFPVEKTEGVICINLGDCDEKEECSGVMFAKLLLLRHIGDYHNKLREKGLVYESNAYVVSGRKTRFEFTFTCSSENVNKIIDVIGEMLKERRKTLYDQKLIDKIQKKLEYANDEKSTMKATLGLDLLNEYFAFGTKLFKHKDRKRRKKIFESITNEDVQKFVQKYFSTPQNIYVTIQTKDKNADFYSYQDIQNIIVGKPIKEGKGVKKDVKKDKSKAENKNNTKIKSAKAKKGKTTTAKNDKDSDRK